MRKLKSTGFLFLALLGIGGLAIFSGNLALAADTFTVNSSFQEGVGGTTFGVMPPDCVDGGGAPTPFNGIGTCASIFDPADALSTGTGYGIRGGASPTSVNTLGFPTINQNSPGFPTMFQSGFILPENDGADPQRQLYGLGVAKFVRDPQIAVNATLSSPECTAAFDSVLNLGACLQAQWRAATSPQTAPVDSVLAFGDANPTNKWIDQLVVKYVAGNAFASKARFSVNGGNLMSGVSVDTMVIDPVTGLLTPATITPFSSLPDDLSTMTIDDRIAQGDNNPFGPGAGIGLGHRFEATFAAVVQQNPDPTTDASDPLSGPFRLPIEAADGELIGPFTDDTCIAGAGVFGAAGVYTDCSTTPTFFASLTDALAIDLHTDVSQQGVWGVMGQFQEQAFGGEGFFQQCVNCEQGGSAANTGRHSVTPAVAGGYWAFPSTPPVNAVPHP